MPNQKNKSLINHLDRIEVMRSELLEEVKLLSEEQINSSPSKKEWSILEIIEHLVLGEEYVMSSIFRSEEPTHRKRKPYHFVRYYIVMGILSSSFKVKTPSKKMNPSSNSSLEELNKRWKYNHQTIRDYLMSLNSETVKKAVFFHPISGPLKPDKALKMLEVHLKRHWKQIKRLTNTSFVNT
ncbi:MAG: hypothetical protein BalsKO_17940 [Balneolaceae bacterium]